MLPHNEYQAALTRRAFLRQSPLCLGGFALASLLDASPGPREAGGAPPALHFAPTAKRVIFLCMSGGPSHIDLFDPKPKVNELAGQNLPPSVHGGQRLAQAAGQRELPLVGTLWPFVRRGRSGVLLSELLPHTGRIVDDIALVRSLYTDPINHDPAMTFLLTGSPQPGRPSLGSWVSYGLGSLSKNLPDYVVLRSGGIIQPLQARYWGAGFLPGQHQGVQFNSKGDPVPYVSNPEGIDSATRRELLDGAQQLNRLRFEALGDPEIATRIAAYEMAYRMQTSAPELTDISKEPDKVLEKYGAERGKPSFANNCLLARRLVERDVRFVQLLHSDWDHHEQLPTFLPEQCRQTDRPAAALVEDLKERGLLADTLVVWGGEFGRTPFGQGAIAKDNFGRDHHPRCFSMWFAGGGIREGIVIGKTDDFGYNVVEEPIHTHDLQATILACLGIDHKKLTYKYQGRDFRLTDVHGEVVTQLLRHPERVAVRG